MKSVLRIHSSKDINRELLCRILSSEGVCLKNGMTHTDEVISYLTVPDFVPT